MPTLSEKSFLAEILTRYGVKDSYEVASNFTAQQRSDFLYFDRQKNLERASKIIEQVINQI